MLRRHFCHHTSTFPFDPLCSCGPPTFASSSAFDLHFANLLFGGAWVSRFWRVCKARASRRRRIYCSCAQRYDVYYDLFVWRLCWTGFFDVYVGRGFLTFFVWRVCGGVLIVFIFDFVFLFVYFGLIYNVFICGYFFVFIFWNLEFWTLWVF